MKVVLHTISGWQQETYNQVMDPCTTTPGRAAARAPLHMGGSTGVHDQVSCSNLRRMLIINASLLLKMLRQPLSTNFSGEYYY